MTLRFSKYLEEEVWATEFDLQYNLNEAYHADYLVEGQEPMSPEAFEAKRKGVAAKGIGHLFKTYGEADKEPMSEGSRKKIVDDQFDKVSKMSKPEYDEHMKNVLARRKGLRAPVSKGNSKTATVGKIASPKAPNGYVPLAMTTSPDRARHYTKSDCSDHKTYNACPGSTEGCRGACLGKHGLYGNATNQGRMDAATQSQTHNEAALRDHASHMYHVLKKSVAKAKTDGKRVIVRPDVTSGGNHTVYKDAIEKHHDADVMAYVKRSPKSVAKTSGE